MKKSMWIIPFLMFLTALVAVILLRGRDILPENTVHKTDPETLVETKRSDVIALFDENFADFENCVYTDTAKIPEGVLRLERGQGFILFVVGEDFESYKQYIAYGTIAPGYENRGGQGYNLGSQRVEIMESWTYGVDYISDITFSTRYREQFLLALGDGWTEGNTEISLILADKATQIEPADRAKGAYVVCANAIRTDGEMHSGYFDARTKLFIGFID